MVKFQRTDHSDRRLRVFFYRVFKSQTDFFFKLSKKCSFKRFLVFNDPPGKYPDIRKNFKMFRALCYHQVFVLIHDVRTDSHFHRLPWFALPLTFLLVDSELS